MLLPFLIVYFCLFMVLIPRYPKRGAKNFIVARNLTPADFENVAQTEDDIEQLKLTCAVLSDILWWKTQSFASASWWRSSASSSPCFCFSTSGFDVMLGRAPRANRSV